MALNGPLVVIPCLNERQTLPAVLDVLLCEGDRLDALFVVADGGSVDGTREWVQERLAREPRLRLFDNTKMIQSAGVNDAVKAYGEGRRWVIRVDAHAEYPAGYLSGLLRAVEASEAQSVVVPMATRGVACFQRAVAAAQNSLLGTGGARHRHGGRSGWVDHGHHALFDLEWFRRIGGYNEAFRANEDAEYDIRLGGAGGRIWMEADCTVTYYPRATLSGLFRQYERNGTGRAKTMLLHRSRPKLRQLGPILVAPALTLAIAAPAALILAAPASLWMFACMTYGVLLGRGRRARCEMLSGIPAMVMHVAWSIGFWKEVFRWTAPGARPPPRGHLTGIEALSDAEAYRAAKALW